MLYLIIAGVVLVVILALFILYRYDKEVLISLAYKACTDAEAYFGEGKGTEKLNNAVAQIKGKLPSFAKLFISESAIKYTIENIALPVLQKIFIKLKGNTADKKIEDAKEIIKKIKTPKKTKNA